MSGEPYDDTLADLPDAEAPMPDRPSAPHRYFASHAHEAALDSLTRAIRENADLLVLTGEVHSGRTTLLKRLTSELSGNFDPVLCSGNGLEFGQVINFLCSELGITHTSPTQISEIGALTAFLAGTDCRPVALLVDDADRLEGNTLEQLLRLSQSMQSGRRRLRMVLSGRPALQPRLKRERATFPILSGAIFVRIGRISNAEAATFVERVAALHTQRHRVHISSTARQAIVEASRGNAGRLTALCRSVLSRTEESGATTVSPAQVAAAISGKASPTQADFPTQPLRRATKDESANPNSSSPVGVGPTNARTHDQALLGGVSLRQAFVGMATLALLVGAGVALLAMNQRSDRPAATAQSPVRAPAAVSLAPTIRERSIAAATAAAASTPAPRPVVVTMPTRSPRPRLPAQTTNSASAQSGQSLTRTEQLPTKSAQVAADLARARSAMARSALTTPTDDNVVKWAESALTIAPGTAAAKELLRETIDRYLAWSNRSLNRNALGDATRYLDRARSISQHAAHDQLAAIEVLEDEIATRTRRINRARRRRGYHMDGPQWLHDVDSWLRTLQLPTDDR